MRTELPSQRAKHANFIIFQVFVRYAAPGSTALIAWILPARFCISAIFQATTCALAKATLMPGLVCQQPLTS